MLATPLTTILPSAWMPMPYPLSLPEVMVVVTELILVTESGPAEGGVPAGERRRFAETPDWVDEGWLAMAPRNAELGTLEFGLEIKGAWAPETPEIDEAPMFAEVPAPEPPEELAGFPPALPGSTKPELAEELSKKFEA